MLETDNLKLPLYELDDAANLADGYNDAMRKVDAAYQTNENRFPITSADIEDGGVNTVDIANGAITSNKIATAAVTDDKLADSVWKTIENLQAGKDTIVVLGDSFTDTAQNPSIINWTNTFSRKTGYKIENLAKSGASYAHEGNTFAAQLANATTTPERCAGVIVFGGINDVIQNVSAESVASGFTSLINNIRTKYPAITILIVTNGSDRPAIQPQTYTYTKNIAKLCMAQNVIFWSGNHFLHFWETQLTASDNLHPTQEGHSKIAMQMQALWCGEEFNFPRHNLWYNQADGVTINSQYFMFDGKNFFQQVDYSWTGTTQAFVNTFNIGANIAPMVDNLYIQPIPGTVSTTGNIRSAHPEFDSNSGTVHYSYNPVAAIQNPRMTMVFQGACLY